MAKRWSFLLRSLNLVAELVESPLAFEGAMLEERTQFLQQGGVYVCGSHECS
jgi:hypothetical protein